MDAKGNDTFVLSDWLRCIAGQRAATLCAACSADTLFKIFPSKRLFGILNATFDDGQMKTLVDCIELSMQSQYNKQDE